MNIIIFVVIINQFETIATFAYAMSFFVRASFGYYNSCVENSIM